MAQLFGMMLAVYLICKLLEWAVFKRLLRNYDTMVIVSTVLVTGLSIYARIKHSERAGTAFDPVWIIILAVGGLVLIVGRILWHMRRLARTQSETS